MGCLVPAASVYGPGWFVHETSKSSADGSEGVAITIQRSSVAKLMFFISCCENLFNCVIILV